MKTIKECKMDLRQVSVGDFYLLCQEKHIEGKTGRIRFPKELRDLHRLLTGDYKSSKLTITSQLIDILNKKSLEYCDKKILEINQFVESLEGENK